MPIAQYYGSVFSSDSLSSQMTSFCQSWHKSRQHTLSLDSLKQDLSNPQLPLLVLLAGLLEVPISTFWDQKEKQASTPTQFIGLQTSLQSSYLIDRCCKWWVIPSACQKELTLNISVKCPLICWHTALWFPISFLSSSCPLHGTDWKVRKSSGSVSSRACMVWTDSASECWQHTGSSLGSCWRRPKASASLFCWVSRSPCAGMWGHALSHPTWSLWSQLDHSPELTAWSVESWPDIPLGAVYRDPQPIWRSSSIKWYHIYTFL